MKKILLLIIIPFFGTSQTNHELEFNSTTFDYVEMPNTSAVIANKTAFSISGWVNPQSNTNHGGIMGFRNNIDADFYLLQLQNTNNIEARFRNSLGVNYDIIAINALDFNQWQHLSFTYDGSYIRLYKDGIFLDSTAANGTIIQTSESFRLGSLNYQGSEFYMIGRLDEIRLWDVSVSQLEINNWMCFEVNTSHPNYSNLMGYWNLNEGIGITAYDQTFNGNNGTLLGGTGWQISSTCLGSAVLCGDVNEDGVVDQTDVTDINNFITGVFVPVFNLWAADVNCDGGINILDITTLNSFISGAGSVNCCSSVQSLVSNFSSNSVCLGDITVFTDLSSGGTTPYTYLWDFGDGTTSISQNPSHMYSMSGWYTVTLIVMDSNGLSDTSSTSIFISNAPTANFIVSDDTVCIGDSVCFTDLSILGSDPLIAWDWSFGSGDINPCTIFTNIGPYSVTLWVTDAAGCVDTYTQSIYIDSCNTSTGLNNYTTSRKLLRVTDILGKDTNPKRNIILFYIYNDGTVEKKILIK